MTAKLWKCGDIITCASPSGGKRVWRVIGIFLGALGQEDVVELSVLDKHNSTEGRMCVPVDLLNNAIGASVNN